MELKETRSAMAVSNVIQMAKAQWSSWTVDKAVTDGMLASSWVYLATSKISEAASSVPLVVKDKDGQILKDHPITKLLAKPSYEMPYEQWMMLLSEWTSQAGMAYAHKNVGQSGVIRELTPISPDRLCGYRGKNSKLLIDGYEAKAANGKSYRSSKYTTDTIVRICRPNPADPLRGLSPLMAAAKAVDIDASQQEWNKSLLDNRGNPDFAITYDEPLEKKQTNTLMRQIMQQFRGKRNAGKPLILGGKGKVVRLGFGASEMDYLESRKWNRTEILAIYGVPEQLAGSAEASTYSNFNEAKKIFWTNTVVPHLALICGGLSFGLKDELGEGQYIDADLSKVSALSEVLKEKAETAKLFTECGVPMSITNDRLNLGLSAFDGWDKPYYANKNAAEKAKAEAETDERSAELDRREKELTDKLQRLEELHGQLAKYDSAA